MKNLSLGRSFALSAAALLLVGGFFVANTAIAVITGTFTALETVANVPGSTIPAVTFTGGADFVDATIPAVTFVGGADEIKASTTISVGALPGNTENFTIGTCVVTFITTTLLTVDETDCVDNVATIDTDTGALDTPRTSSEIATVLQALSNVSGGVHAALTVGTPSATTISFTTSGAETSNTNINFSPSANITSSSVTTGVVATAASATITVTGGLIAGAPNQSVTIDGIIIPLGASVLTDIQVAATIDAVDFSAKDYDVTSSGANLTFTKDATGSAGNGGPLTMEDATYTTAGPTTASATITIPSGLVANASDQSVTIDGIIIPLGASVLTDIQVAATIDAVDFSAKDYDVTSSGANLTFTKDATGSAGNGGPLTMEDANYGNKAQEVTFTPASVSVGETFRATINGNDYDYLAGGADTVQTVVEALAPIMDANADVVCVEDDLKVTCNASVAGTAFTYAATVVDETSPAISSLSFTPDNGYAKIGDVVTLNITSDQPGYSAGAITVNGVAVAGFSDLGGGLYSATYTVVSGDTDRASGTTPASVVLNDGDGNSNVAYTTVLANTLKVDANAPTLVSAETTSTTTIDATFSEDLDGSTVNGSGNEFAVAGHTVSGASELGGVVTLTLSTVMGTEETPNVTFTNIDNFKDLAGNQAVSPATVPAADGVAPVLSETAPVQTPDNDSTPDYTFSSGEAGAITYGGDCSSASAVAAVGSNLITFDALADGPHSNCTVTVTDVSLNASAPLAVSAFTIDTVPPTVALSSLVTDPTNDSPIFGTATFSEDVTGFSGADIDLVNGILTSFLPVSGSVYNFGVSPVIQGLVTVDVAANVALDTSGNDNTAATQFSITYDSVAPIITMLGVSPVNIEYGETYVDDGATASDTLDGDVTGSIVVVDPVDTSTLGTYTVTYNVSDAAGNAAIEVTRTVNVIQRAITVTAATDTKEYDATTDSFGTPTITSGSPAFLDGENFTQTFDNKNVGTGKTLIPDGVMDDGNGGANYEVTFITDTTGEITAKDLTVTATGVNKVYDGTTDATVTLSDDRIPGDVLTAAYSDADFDDKDVGTGKDVSVSGISISGTDAGNYNANTTADTTADITALAIVGSITADNKVYDNTTDATISGRFLTGVIGADDVSYVGGTATFDTEDVGTGKLVSATGLSLSGTDADNYTVNTSANTTADITPLALTGSFTADNKVYDSTAAATITGRSLSGVLGADVVTYDGGTATFSDKNAGIAKTVNGTGFAIIGADAGNYTVNTTASTTADITALAIVGSITADNKVFDGNTTATIASRTLTGVLGADVVSYVGGTATFDDANFGVGKTVTAIDLSLSGADASNYSVNTTATTLADITSSSGGSSGSRRAPATPATPAVPGITPAVPAIPGQVLGSEKFIFTLFLKMGPPYGAAVQNEVMELQKYLNTLGFDCGLADGKFGPKTKACVVRFQLANGLKGDGIVGPLTRAVLNKPQ